MTLTQKVILVALLVLGGLCLIVGITLSHYIGGFLRTVEEEAREQEPDGKPGSGGKPAPEAAPEEKKNT